jgi:hypothetical protein
VSIKEKPRRWSAGEVKKLLSTRHYHIDNDVQAFLIALSPLWLAILIAIWVRR